LNELRALIQERLPWPELFDLFIRDLCQTAGFVQEGVTIRRATHRPGLPPHLQAAGQKVRQLSPPNRSIPLPAKNSP
jgi:hypothetical protein